MESSKFSQAQIADELETLAIISFLMAGGIPGDGIYGKEGASRAMAYISLQIENLATKIKPSSES